MDEVNSALQRVARGTGIVFFGGIIGTFLGFLYRTIIARHFERAQYGTFNLALTLLSVALIVALIGFPTGLPREISRYRKEAPQEIRFLISTALLIGISASTLMVVVYFFLAPWFSQVLNDPYLSHALRWISPALPFMALSAILIAISRGFDRVRENFYYQRLLSPLLYLLVTIVVVFGGFDFRFLFAGYVVVQAVVAVLLLRELKKIGLLEFGLFLKRDLAAKLVLFSVPLMLTGILEYVMGWTDTLMLGHYFNSDIVGLYNSASPLARFIPIFLASAGFLFMPIATGFYTEGKLDELRRIYVIVTRWVFLPTFPLFLLLMVFPEATITGLFGAKYSAAAPALQILALGFVFHTILGLNGMSLVVIGQPNKNLMGNVFAATTNVVLNVLLIPPYGIEGAALATAVSYVVANLFRSGWLYRETGIHPFGRSYTVQLVAATATALALKVLAPEGVNIFMAILLVALSFMVYLVVVLLLRTVEPEDVALLRAVGQRLGWNLEPLARILERFSRDPIARE